ncbi:MAG: hypothetical protein LBM62_04055 [Mediterranea sp.]|jgi:hypothetical protein|nr:hypothetical protein [Mediterranea sp.]
MQFSTKEKKIKEKKIKNSLFLLKIPSPGRSILEKKAERLNEEGRRRRRGRRKERIE